MKSNVFKLSVKVNLRNKAIDINLFYFPREGRTLLYYIQRTFCCKSYYHDCTERTPQSLMYNNLSLYFYRQMHLMFQAKYTKSKLRLCFGHLDVHLYHLRLLCATGIRRRFVVGIYSLNLKAVLLCRRDYMMHYILRH